MKQFEINVNEAGQRLDKYLSKRLRLAPKGFLYRMLRKKNITLNGHKAQGFEKLAAGDAVRLYLSDETFDKFSGAAPVLRACRPLDILYEDKDIILINKPAGLLSQPDDSGKASMVEYLTGYLLETGELTERDLETFRPSVTNRLDRNTSGILAAGKSLAGLQELSALFHDRRIRKEYLCIVQGVLNEKRKIRGYLKKNPRYNKVTVSGTFCEGAQAIETVYDPLDNNGRVTLLKVGLITGRTHQIRAHLAAEGHPLMGDHKYGSAVFNRYAEETYRLRRQFLHAFQVTFPVTGGRFAHLSQKTFRAPVPEDFRKILEGEGLEESYNENLERNP